MSRNKPAQRFSWRYAKSHADVVAAQRLRHLAFRGQDGRDVDRFDDLATHVLIETPEGELICCFRFLHLKNGGEISESYSAQFYDLSGLSGYSGSMLELGRFCVAPGIQDPDLLRLAWGILTVYVEENEIELLFGCSSFAGTEPTGYRDAFLMLTQRHIAPKRWLPKVKAPNVFRFARRFRGEGDRKRALTTMPPLLRSYLTMGGWVSDHAVVDRDLDTLHVFTGLETRLIPMARKRALRGLVV